MTDLTPTHPHAPPAEVRYRWTLLRAGSFRLDGGSMFGLIPRPIWTRLVKPDDRGRITVEHNCLLLDPVTPVPAAPGTPPPGPVLIEVGTGDKLDDKSKDLFAMDGRWVGDALAEAGRRPEEISAVIVTHLHFDHAGALTRRCRDGETPDWTGPASCFTGSRPDHGVKRTFPNARVFAQRREWADALAGRSVMTRTYFRDHLEPIEPQVSLVDSPRPFPVGLIPDRDARPPAPVGLRMTPVLPGIGVFLAPGHTWGQQAIAFTDDLGRTVVFTPDVIPTRYHLGPAFSLGYDVEPYTSMITRRWFLEAAVEHDWLLVLDHDPDEPVRRVRPDGGGWFEWRPA